MKGLNTMHGDRNVRQPEIPQGVISSLKCFVAVWALSGDSLSLMLTGYCMDVPLVKYLFTLLSALDGWGIENVFTALGMGIVFYCVRDRQKNPGLSLLSAFFALCTVVGISYEKTNSWDCIFLFHLQSALAAFVALGYYFLYKNCILFVGYVFEKKRKLLRREPVNKLEDMIFRKHAFLGPLLTIFVLGLPWLIFYFPGTLQWDAHAQLWMNLGVVEKTGHFPVAMTELMGGCIRLGRILFQSDSMGLFFYTGLQFSLQALVFSYAFYVMKRMNAPILFGWLALLIWVIYPFFPIWGYTMVKDTMHYVFVLLLVVTLQNVIMECHESIKWWQVILVITSVIGIAITRNDGRYIVFITMAVAILAYKRHWKIFLAGGVVCFLTVFIVEGVYMPYNNIAAGPAGEMLSIPLQQTARYLREHYEELSEEEARVLQEGFSVELESVGSLYNPVISDPVKANFEKHPSTEYLKEYIKVWFKQCLKHPDTYVQAFLNHVYGYFYPGLRNYGEYLAIFYIGNSEHWDDGYLDIEYAVSDNSIRRILENSLYLMEKVPVLSMFLSAGFHTYLLLGEAVYLWTKRKRREMLVLVPPLVVLLICMASPVNAYLRYAMPIMVTLPVNAAWCYVMGNSKETAELGEKDEKGALLR